MEGIKYPNSKKTLGKVRGPRAIRSVCSQASWARIWSLRWNSRAAQTKECNVLDIVDSLSLMGLVVK